LVVDQDFPVCTDVSKSNLKFRPQGLLDGKGNVSDSAEVILPVSRFEVGAEVFDSVFWPSESAMCRCFDLNR